MVSSALPIIPVLLSGGTGTRLWPLSREAYPKQLLALAGAKTMLQGTAERVGRSPLFGRLRVIANAEHRFVIAEQLRALGVSDPQIILEPFGRNTAPAAAIAAMVAVEEDPNALVLLMPADHIITDVEAFHRTVERGAQAARLGRLVLFGIRPQGPATGYGYIKMADPVTEAMGVYDVGAFVEKPDTATAQGYLAAGDYVWNSGIFLLPAQMLLDEFEAHEPGVLPACRMALAGATRDMDFLRLEPEAFESAPSISLDYAVMEKTKKAAVAPADFDWTDVGSWSALHEIGTKDTHDNVTAGDVILENVRGSYIRSEGQLVAAIGVKDLIVVATPDAVLIADKAHDQAVKTIVDRLKAEGRTAATQTPRVHRPWGYYQSIHTGDRFQVKRITVNPGAKLSLQKHFHRAEHWVVVNGTALVTRDEDEIMLHENESVYLPLGCVHRLENPGKLPLNLIEVQSGPYLGEDDIVRIEDVYART